MKRYFSPFEIVLWCLSVGLIAAAFALFGEGGWLKLTASLVGVTSLLFSAKGNPIGQALMMLFSLLYGVISLSFAYYGEMITYLGMTMPMAVLALIAWIRHPSAGSRAEVAVNHLRRREIYGMIPLTVAVTAAFYLLLKAVGTANLIPSTLSVTTSFAAVYLTFRRSPYFALAYAANDAVLILLWSLASAADRSYLSVTVCFAVFLINDLYGFYNWLRMRKRQTAA